MSKFVNISKCQSWDSDDFKKVQTVLPKSQRQSIRLYGNKRNSAIYSFFFFLFPGSMSSFNLHLLGGTWQKSFRVEIRVHITVGFLSHHDVAMTSCPYKGMQMRWTKFFGTSLDEVQKIEESSVGFQKTITTTHCQFANFLPLAKDPLWTCSFYLHELFEAETWWFWSQWDYYTCQNNQKYEAVW